MESKDKPLATAALHILLALSESDLHGYGIMQSVKQQSEGGYKLGPGTLYANLAALLESGLVGEKQRRLENGEARREYCLTAGGKRVLRVEIRRLTQIVASARERLSKLDRKNA